MNKLIKSWLVVLVLLTPSSNAAVAQEVAVIVNPAYEMESLDQRKIEQIFMGKLNVMRAYDLPESSPLRERFYTVTVGRSLQQVSATRAKLVFSGRGHPPEELVNSRAVKSAVASDPKAIGYVDISVVDDTVKVIAVNGANAGSPF